MKYKNGYVFVETVIVLTLVALSLALMLSSYSLLVRKSKTNEYYDLPKDKYLLYNIVNLGNNTGKYFGLDGNVLEKGSSFISNISNCSIIMQDRLSDCQNVFVNNNLVSYIIIYNLKSELESNNIFNYDSPTIEYLKTLKKCKDKDCNIRINYVVGVFCRRDDGTSCYNGVILQKNDINNKYYFVSLELEG